ncbi:MAG: hypothetical protein ACOX1L_01285 [Erysipelotrichaceae bacterium]|jgi:CobQ-like glutamine amidotransferase family enzyme
MIINVMYPSAASLYGDSFNVEYLKMAVKDCKVVYSSFNERPYFADHDIDMFYMGSMMERYQKTIIDELQPYKERIIELIESGVVFLCTGNSFEIFGKAINDIEALNIFDYQTEINFDHHHNSCFLGEYKNMEIVGFKSCFSSTFNNNYDFIKVKKGFGFKDNNFNEGVRYKNFFGTYLIGPLLVLNPHFSEYLLNLLKVEYQLPYQEAIDNAYNIRVKEYNSYKEIREFKH